MKKILKVSTNILTIAATLFLATALTYVFVKNQPISDVFAAASFCYVAIAAFNFLMLGEATLWHKDTDV